MVRVVIGFVTILLFSGEAVSTPIQNTASLPRQHTVASKPLVSSLSAQWSLLEIPSCGSIGTLSHIR